MVSYLNWHTSIARSCLLNNNIGLSEDEGMYLTLLKFNNRYQTFNGNRRFIRYILFYMILFCYHGYSDNFTRENAKI